MKKTDLAYVAGIVDGEGSIGIYLQKKRGCKRGHTFELHVSVTNTETWLPQWLKFAFGGSVSVYNNGHPNDKTCWKWQISSHQAGLFLKQILPYLRLKRPQAELAIKFQDGKRIRGGCFPGLTDEQFAIEEAQSILLKSMKEEKI